jgi:starch synthase
MRRPAETFAPDMRERQVENLEGPAAILDVAIGPNIGRCVAFSSNCDDCNSLSVLFLPTLSWPNAVLQLFRSGRRVRMVSPSAVSILMTSGPVSASIRVQCGPAIVVEKSSTRRPSGGIVYASHLTTVSATYAREITTAELGCGLEGLLRQRSNAEQLTGILNGIDESWDPRFCAQLAQPFGAGDWTGKQANADYVRRQFGLALSRGPIFGLVARLVHQKGVDLVLSAADEIIRDGGQIVVTGSGEPEMEQALVKAHRRRPDAIGVIIGFNDAQARRIFAGSDFTLMPSRFEPCGLSQMYAQRFGSLPIGHQTGGLAETIKDGETGFLFAQPSAESFLGGISRAFDAFRAKDRLDSMRRSAMARSFSWDLSAACYSALYRRIALP